MLWMCIARVQTLSTCKSLLISQCCFHTPAQQTFSALRFSPNRIKYSKFNSLWPLPRPLCISILLRSLHRSRQTLNTQKRWQVDTNVTRNTIVYSYTNDKLYKLISFFGIVQFLFWLNLAGFCYSIDRAPIDADTNLSAERARIASENATWMKVFDTVIEYRYRMAIGCLGIAYLVLVFAWAYPQRSIAKLVLLKGGRDLEITTYKHFGRKRAFIIPLDQVSCQHSRASVTTNLSLKVKGRWFYYLIDNRDGIYHSPDLFDFAIGLKRDFK